MDIMATHPIKREEHAKQPTESSALQSLIGVLIGIIIWAVLVLIATW